MSVEVRIRYGDKYYNIDREVENHFPGAREDIVEFVRTTLTDAMADIERLESK